MKIIVFGATGKTGLNFINLALEQGHDILAFVRNPEKINISNDKLKIYKGSPLNIDDVKKAIIGQDIVVSCLGGNDNNKSTIITDMMKNIVDAMKMSNVNRIIHISTAGIHDETPGIISKIVIALFFKNAIKDHKGAANYIINSGLEYTIARPMNLIDGEAKGNYRVSITSVPKGGVEVSRADLAAFLLSAIDNSEYNNKTIGIAY